ncbi:LutB/LldF family L-lactate oxidation iron-sulfur protein [Paenactinomyces guangxiensis]|uniref:Iron-sulfur cluster-binding protein n=1 Tax=Paenactinomyces guangxiensis TaxID=1490290 RepID=A0A7W1WNW3_9BACL|nr:LutB/LldF family L-lactate oxidation iron-sulfur protein [Paenactinomyces guangxiensis]MBA4493358.1 iron-sulfur cluster-binding protein [Paenactinomyces guangxiensis]MBH8593705.1 iron-sulfur cluster-binding protein [Paenactinomyces guangxiensis]
MPESPGLSLKERSRLALQDEFLRSAVRFTTERLRNKKKESTERLGNWEEWRERGRQIRAHTIQYLDYYLDLFANRVEQAGGHVHFAKDAREAAEMVLGIAREKQAKSVVKSKSMVSEEVHVNQRLAEQGIECIETDLGEYIIQLANQAPSHIIIPAIHQTRRQIAELFSKEGGEQLSEETRVLTAFARRRLREKFLQAEIGMTGCNFAIAESGSVILFSNEGNGRMVTTLPKTHIVMMGMERIIPSWEDLEVMANLLPRSATGQKLTVYMSAMTGPRRRGEWDGAEEMHVIILDNGRSNQLGDPEFQEVLHCIRCGACLNVCPVYRHIGGHAYGSVYPGPIGAVLSPLLNPGDEQMQELSYASSLCAACYEACPVKIPLHDMLVHLRRKNVESARVSIGEKIAFKGFASAFKNARRYRITMNTLRNIQKHTVRDGSKYPKLTRLAGPAKEWAEHRSLPFSEKKSFRDSWKTLQEELAKSVRRDR